MGWEYLQAVMKHWILLILGFFGSIPWWFRALLPEKIKTKLDNIFDPSSLKVFGIVCISVAFVMSNYLAWKDERKQLLRVGAELTSERDENTVKFDGEINQITGMYKGDKNFYYILTVSVRNSGADSIARNYRAEVTYGDTIIKPNIIALLNGKIHLKDPKTGKMMATYSQPDAIYEKTLVPIRRGEIKSGIIFLMVKNGAKYKDIKGDWDLYFEDYTGKVHKIHTDALSGREGPVGYIPGVVSNRDR